VLKLPTNRIERGTEHVRLEYVQKSTPDVPDNGGLLIIDPPHFVDDHRRKFGPSVRSAYSDRQGTTGRDHPCGRAHDHHALPLDALQAAHHFQVSKRQGVFQQRQDDTRLAGALAARRPSFRQTGTAGVDCRQLIRKHHQGAELEKSE
jgi:hypothetical protein